MTSFDTGTQLLRAVLADPADDTARLVYADWLQENGQPERAEFVRVQVELAAIPNPPAEPPSPLTRPEHHDQLLDFLEWRSRWRTPYYDLRRRERELLAAHEATWRRGRRCERCKGQRVLGVGDPLINRRCPDCHGTGWLGSLAEYLWGPDQRKWHDIDRQYWLVPAEWSRGFVSTVRVSTVRVTLDQLTREWGRRTCETCKDGEQPGKKHPYWAGNIDCPTCDGRGTFPVPWAARLFAEWPVTRVVTDREPSDWTREDGGQDYVWTVRTSNQIEIPGDLPRWLFAFLEGGTKNRDNWACRFPTAEAARDAFSDAVCRWGRAEAAKLEGGA